MVWGLTYYFFKKDFLYLFLQRGEGKEKERERKINVREKYRSVASCTPPPGDLARNPSMCPDGESNLQPFTLTLVRTI